MNTQQRQRWELLGFTVGARRDGAARVWCSACDAVSINGVPSHEVRCPNAKHECEGCNAIIPRRIRYCDDCR